jgi:hypothetical protein
MNFSCSLFFTVKSQSYSIMICLVLISKVKVVEFPTKIDSHFLGEVNTALSIMF